MPSLRILLVDDDHDGLSALARLLRFCGHEVHEAMTVREAVAVGERSRCDLLIADIGLPDGTAMALISQLRRMYPLPAIALTGHDEKEYAQESRSAGFDKHLLKPIVFDDLIAAISDLRPVENAATPAARAGDAP